MARFTVRNVGHRPALISGFARTESDGIKDYTPIETTCPATIASGTTCTVDVVFVPVKTGWRNAWLSVGQQRGQIAATIIHGQGLPAKRR
jgi:hypothetical protein